MKELKGALIFAQSGGPTSVINASAYGVFSQAFKHNCITEVYGACNGIKGVLDERIIDMTKESEDVMMLLPNTPSSALGSVRYKLKDIKEDDTDYLRILEVFKKYNVRYFMYNGGNDSMDTCNKVSKFLQNHGYECNVIGVPKTIDNDLYGTDHCPGYGSAAKYIATTCMEIALDAKVYDKGQVIIIEVMGRNAGWLTAASALASYNGLGPDLIYLPERDFDTEKFLSEVEDVWNKNSNCIVAVSEGIRDKNGVYINQYSTTGSSERDSFNHVQMGGACHYLAGLVKARIPKVKVRAIELSLMQRCAAHIASQTDIDEAMDAGRQAVLSAVNGMTDLMMAFKRGEDADGEYRCEVIEQPLSIVANTEKKVPEYYINEEGNFIRKEFIDYVQPLIVGEPHLKFKNGLPCFAILNKDFVKK